MRDEDSRTVDLPLADRLELLWAHLGLETAHVATQMAGELADFVRRAPDRIGGIVFVAPTRLDAEPYRPIGHRALAVAGDSGLVTRTVEAACASVPEIRRLVIPDYAPTGWSDVIADHPDAIAQAMLSFLGAIEATAPRPDVGREGEVAGLRYRIEGRGPALMLPPIFLAPSQWTPAMPHLAERFSVVTLGGPNLGGVALLEDRARAPTYGAMFRTLIELLDPAPGATLLDVGCGAGSLDRLLAAWRADVRITATDVNPFLLGEAAQLTAASGFGERVSFHQGDATALPFADAGFDHAFSITVLEECDAARALAEMVRVVRPGGRIGVVVRATDMPQWWNLDLPEPLATRVTEPPQSVGATGIADARLYPAMRRAGLVDLVCFPSLITLDRPDGPIWRYREDDTLGKMSADERRAWTIARDAAEAESLLFMAHPLHAAVGRKPA